LARSRAATTPVWEMKGSMINASIG
jgi:hypothetical protein